MQSARLCYCITISLIAIFLLFSLRLTEASATSSVATLTLSKEYSSQWLAPEVNDYVKYDVTITNLSNAPIENQSLWVSFVSENGVTSVYTKFQVPPIPPNEHAQLHLGPFKMRESGENSLYLGINRQGNSSLANEVLLNFEPAEPVDKIIVYDSMRTHIVILAVLSATSGGAIVSIVVIPYYHEKKHNEK